MLRPQHGERICATLMLLCSFITTVGARKLTSLRGPSEVDTSLSWIPHGKLPPLPAVLPQPPLPPKPPPPPPATPPMPPAQGAIVRLPPESTCRGWPCPASASGFTGAITPETIAKADAETAVESPEGFTGVEAVDEILMPDKAPARGVVDATPSQAEKLREERLAEVFPPKLLDEVPPLPFAPPPPVPPAIEAEEPWPTKEQLVRETVEQKAEITKLKVEVSEVTKELQQTQQALLSWQKPPPQPAQWYKAAFIPPEPPRIPAELPNPSAFLPGFGAAPMLPCPPAGCVH
mmetsp:Transcript_3170/g.7128  ORF Transcript_3170/g.7128 Transcript_3170/m.7128 type:complete len:291 (+) Transcript_3170:112-984(+)